MSQRAVSIDHLNYTVQNLEESVRFYARTFGFEKVEGGMEKDGPWAILRAGDSMLCLYESPRLTDLRSSPESEKLHHIFHFGLRIHDRAKWEATVKEERLKIYYGGAIRYPHSTSWYIKDPTGHMIEVALWDEDTVRFES